jgi:hypothetical protein
MPGPVRHPATDDSAPPVSPGDEAARGTPGAGENVCKRCGGSGKLEGKTCPECEGTGTVVVGVGGA